MSQEIDYFKKIENNPYEDLKWNIPERKQGIISIIGGNSQNFRTPVKVSEFLENNYPVERVNAILPDTLKNKLPNLPNLIFLSSTDSGSFAEENELLGAFSRADYNILIGDLSKNAITGRAVVSACENSASPLLITRDSVDLIVENGPEKILMNENLVFFASIVQLQKLLRSVYYPKMLLMTQSLVQVAEVLHKFTLSYPVSIITLHNDQVLVVKNGEINAIPTEKTGYSPIMIWGGELAAKIAALNLFNPHNFIKATVSAVFQ